MKNYAVIGTSYNYSKQQIDAYGNFIEYCNKIKKEFEPKKK
jgi:hypothetical protein